MGSRLPRRGRIWAGGTISLSRGAEAALRADLVVWDPPGRRLEGAIAGAEHRPSRHSAGLAGVRSRYTAGQVLAHANCTVIVIGLSSVKAGAIPRCWIALDPEICVAVKPVALIRPS